MAHIWIPIVFTAVLQLASHYLPWEKFAGRSLHLIERYILGVVVLLLPLSIWAWVARIDIPAWALWAAAGASGIGVGFGYWFDHAKRIEQDLQDAREREELLKVQRDAQN